MLRAVHRAESSHAIAGVDISEAALMAAKKNLPKGTVLTCTDALAAFAPKSGGSRTIPKNKLPDAIIANPPWGATVGHSRVALKELGYDLARGQFDSFELFVELSLKAVRKGGAVVLIIPDSIFQPEHEYLRQLLCTKTRVKLIARLGEGFFDGVYRGAVILVIRNEPPASGAAIRCLRLPKAWRADVVAGRKSLADSERELGHFVPQWRFSADPHYRFDIDTRESERHRISVIEQHIDGWTNWLDSTRGVELSKTGTVVYCPNCNWAHPNPRRELRIHCTSCQRKFSTRSAISEAIIVPISKQPRRWKPLIVGEDVDRYEAKASRSIKPNVAGINYKSDEAFNGRKMVIRKTGVGLKAAIDETGALTNQVVFIYRLRHNTKEIDFLLDYFLGVLCSRALLAYHLKKLGENEWRSHPYITQRTIADLPVPNVCEGTWQWQQARAIAEAVRRRHLSGSWEDDLRVDCLVAGLFGLKDSDCEWVLSVLDRAQSLEPIRTLRLHDRQALKPLQI